METAAPLPATRSPLEGRGGFLAPRSSLPAPRLHPPLPAPHLKAALFDMDGVLYNSMPRHAICWEQAMAKYGLKMTQQQAYEYEGMRGVETIQLIARQQKGIEMTEEEAQPIYDEKSRLFHLMGDAPIMEGAKELMQAMQAQGMQIGIVTGSGQKPLIRRVLNDFRQFVDQQHIVTAYDVKHGKPAPDPYLMGLRKAGNLQPHEAIVVENAPLGVAAGVAAGIFTIAINSGNLPKESLSQADLLFDSMNDLYQAWNQIINKKNES